MVVFNEGNPECVRNLLRPAERVLRQGRDVTVEDFETRKSLWERIQDSYSRYLEGECGDFLRDLDSTFRAKFEAALAVLAWSFWKKGEAFPPAEKSFSEREIGLIDEILKYNVFEITTMEDILEKLYRRDEETLQLLKTYYLGVDRWIEEQLEDPEIKLPLRYYLKRTWKSYREKIDAAINEASKYGWFRTLMEEWEREKTEEVEAVRESYEARVGELKKRIAEMVEFFEEERRKLEEELSASSLEEVERLRREKEELIERFEREKAELARRLTELKDEELRKKLEEELARAKEEALREARLLEEKLRRRELELREKEMELRKRELELSEKENLLKSRIEEILAMSGKVEKGSRLVLRDEARIGELNFVGRMKSKFAGEVRLLGRTYSVERIEEKKGEDTARFAGKLDEKSLKNLPENRYVEVALKEKKLLGRKERILVRGVYLTRVERLAELGLDTDPLTLAEVNVHLIDARDSKENARTILVIASPLGFEERVRRYVSSEDFHRNFYSENVSLILLDTESGEVIHNPNDRYAKALVPLVRLELDEEIYARVRECVRKKLEGRDYLPLSECLDCGDEEYVRRAFYEIAREGNLVKYIDGFGLVLIRK
ncbi:hypothetical protein [Thermococcus barophilus]|uniref:Uncharacterized protein n=1 Tax=Thermococcus barophilus (strain DSM 11836 / MP) TaxID=391623 RepID=F0LHX1_THEBM|nr:hypothetical protein [Thermococcus barophilus]ADT84371.1 hypothetical protein TERMP_01396 [Thermococcus barophilus MP]